MTTYSRGLAKRQKRLLPFVRKERQKDVPGLGKFVWESVGSSQATTGIFVYFHPQGKDEAIQGWMPVHCIIRNDMEIVWEVQNYRNQRNNSEEFPPEAWEVALEMAQKIHETDEVCFVFNVLGAVEPAVRAYDNQVFNMEETIRTAVIRMETFPSKKAECELLIEHTEAQLIRFKEKNSQRICQLRPVLDAIQDWCEDDTETERKGRFIDIYEEVTRDFADRKFSVA